MAVLVNLLLNIDVKQLSWPKNVIIIWFGVAKVEGQK